MKKLFLITATMVALALVAAGCAFLPASAQEGATPTPTPIAPAPPAKPWLGLAVADINPRLAQELGLNLGVVVKQVVEGSPAAAAGFQMGDIILKVNGNPINSVADLLKVLKEAKAGDVLTVAGQRGGNPLSLQVTVGKQPQPQAPPPLLPELQGIPRDKLFSYFFSGEIKGKDKEGNPLTIKVLAGTVAAVAEGSVTITPNDGSADITYTLGPEVKVQGKLEVGNPVGVVSVNGQVRLIAKAGWPFHLFRGWPNPIVGPHPRQLPGRVIRGEVKEITAQGFVLALKDKNVTVVLAPDARVRPKDKAELKAGDKVTVVGKHQEDGTFLAGQVVVMPLGLPFKGQPYRGLRGRGLLLPQPLGEPALRLPQT